MSRWLAGCGLDVIAWRAGRRQRADGDRARVRRRRRGGDVRSGLRAATCRDRTGRPPDARARGRSRDARARPGPAPLTSFWTDQYGMRIQYLGNARLADAIEIDGDPDDRNFTAIFSRAGRAVAALLVDRPRASPSGSRADRERNRHDLPGRIDEGACAAHGDCVDLAPEVFELDDVARVIGTAPDDVLLAAAEACPSAAIRDRRSADRRAGLPLNDRSSRRPPRRSSRPGRPRAPFASCRRSRRDRRLRLGCGARRRATRRRGLGARRRRRSRRRSGGRRGRWSPSRPTGRSSGQAASRRGSGTARRGAAMRAGRARARWTDRQRLGREPDALLARAGSPTTSAPPSRRSRAAPRPPTERPASHASTDTCAA